MVGPATSIGEKRLFRVLHPDDKNRCEEALQQTLSSGTYECDYRVVRPDGTEVWVTERGRVLRRDDGAVEKMVGVSRDASAQRKAEQLPVRAATRQQEGAARYG